MDRNPFNMDQGGQECRSTEVVKAGEGTTVGIKGDSAALDREISGSRDKPRVGSGRIR